MEQNETQITSKTPKTFECIKCDFICSKKTDWTRHLSTAKHNLKQNETNETTNAQKNTKNCHCCGLIFNSRTTLWRHKKTCNSEEPLSKPVSSNSENTDFKMLAELFKLQMNENKELKELIIEQNKQMMELAKEGKNITTNCNNTNNNFNLNFFLNEQCKDALNIMDFVNTIKLQISDLDMIGRLGYTEGMSKIFIRNLKELDIFKRPIHCSDLKRETLYVKDKDAWEKENGENVKIKQAIKGIENKNIKQLPQWRAENPTAEDTDTKKHLDYQHILCESMGGSTLEDDDKKHNKIVRNVAKEVVIDKK